MSRKKGKPFLTFLLSMLLAFEMIPLLPAYAEAPSAQTIRDDLRSYYENTLFSSYGDIAGMNLRAARQRNECADVSDINGTLGAFICDFDGDDREELLALRLESQGSKTRTWIEMYEWEDGSIVLGDALSYSTESIACLYQDVHLALFLTDAKNGGQPVIHLYSYFYMNDRSEVVRSFRYKESGFELAGADNLEIGGYHWAEWRENTRLPDTSGSDELVPAGGGSLAGWTTVEAERIKSHDENYVEYFDESVEDYTKRQEQLKERYRQKLKKCGLNRSEKMPSRSFEIGEDHAYEAVAELFEQDAIWIGEFSAIADSMEEKLFIAADHNAFSHLAEVEKSAAEPDLEQYQDWQLEIDLQDYIDQHLYFSRSQVFYDRMDSRFSDDLKQGLDKNGALPAEIVYDLLSDVDSITKVQFGNLSFCDNPYDVILAELILSLGERTVNDIPDWSESSELLKNSKASVEFINTLTGLIYQIQPDFELSKPELSSSLAGMLSDPKTMKQRSPELYETLAKSLQSFMKEENADRLIRGLNSASGVMDGLKKYLAFVDAQQDIVNEIAELYRFYVILDTYDILSSEMKTTLYAIQEKISNDTQRAHMKRALEKMERCLTTENFAEAMLKKAGRDLVGITYENLSTTVFQPAILSMFQEAFQLSDEVFRTWLAAIKAYNVGWSFSNDLTENDTIVECRELIRANYFLANAAYEVMAEDKEWLQAEPTYERAVQFDASYSILRVSEQYSLEAYRRYLKAQQKSFVHAVFEVVILGNEDYNREEINRAVAELHAWETAKCHTEYGIRGSIGMDYIAYSGPMDLVGYDYLGQELFSVKDEVIQGNSMNHDVYQDGEQIVCTFGKSGVYRLEFTAQEAGEFTLAFQKNNPSDACLSQVVYADVSVKAGDSYRGALRSMLAGDHASVFVLKGYDAGVLTPENNKKIVIGYPGSQITETQPVQMIRDAVVKAAEGYYEWRQKLEGILRKMILK